MGESEHLPYLVPPTKILFHWITDLSARTKILTFLDKGIESFYRISLQHQLEVAPASQILRQFQHEINDSDGLYSIK